MKYSSLDNLAETLSFCILKKGKIENFGYLAEALSPARWHDTHTYLSSLGMLGTTKLNSIFLQIT